MRISTLVLALICGLIITGQAQTQKKGAGKPPQRPNIIFILVDELRYNALSCTGHPFVKTL